MERGIFPVGRKPVEGERMEWRRDFSHELAAPHMSLQPTLEHLTYILSILDDEELGFNQLASAIETRPLVAGAIIREANSVSVASGRPVKTVRYALVLLGVRRVRSLLTDLYEATLVEWNRVQLQKHH
jgi:HD-like signal output (HDOD) protein